jgi:hypothetical protein
MNAKSDRFIELLPEYATMYIDICIGHTKEVVSGSGKVVKVEDRHIPTIAYFLNIWLPRNLGESISKSTYYNWLKEEDETKLDAIKKIDEEFKALAGDIVANEGKGIFYAKNKLGWSDRQVTESSLNVTGLPVNIITNSPPLSNDEK